MLSNILDCSEQKFAHEYDGQLEIRDKTVEYTDILATPRFYYAQKKFGCFSNVGLAIGSVSYRWTSAHGDVKDPLLSMIFEGVFALC